VIIEVFALCLSETDGTMLIGDDWSQDPRISWTNVIDQAWFVIELLDVKINGQSLGLSSSIYNAGNGK
jgi:hypothetical protein